MVFFRSSEKMEIDTGSIESNQDQSGANKRQKLNTTRAKILAKPAGGVPVPEDRTYGIETQFFDDPFAISREEVS